MLTIAYFFDKFVFGELRVENLALRYVLVDIFESIISIYEVKNINA